MIEVRSLRKSFDGFTALDGLDISVPDGAVYGLVGPNGAGKSTLIRHLAGILRQDAGEVLYDGEAVFENPAVKAQIAYIPDAVFYYPGASIKDMMLLYRRMYPSFSEERYNKLAPAFGIAPERSFKRLSKGVQKQAAFWLALSLCPKYMLLDEPLDHVTADVAGLTGGQVAVVALLQVDALLVCNLHLELLEISLCFGNIVRHAFHLLVYVHRRKFSVHH